MKRLVKIKLDKETDHNEPVLLAEKIGNQTNVVCVLKDAHPVWGGAELHAVNFKVVDTER